MAPASMSEETLIPRAPAHPSVALPAFAEPLFRGRRVAVLGDATTSLGPLLIARGARVVHVYDPDAGRVAIAAAARAGADRGELPVVSLYADDLGVRDGVYEVVVVPDLSLFEEQESVIKQCRRLLGHAGVALVVSPNPDAGRFLLPPSHNLHRALGYYELFDSVSLQFPEVKMLGQAPFVGYALVDFAEPEPEVSVDTSMVEEPETPEWYIAVASDRAQSVEAFALIEIALAEVGRLALSEPITLPPLKPTGPTETEVMLTEAQARISVLLTENDSLREQIKGHTKAERAFEQASMRAVELEQRSGETEQRLSRAASELEQERAHSAELIADVARLGAALEAAQRAAELRGREQAALQAEAESRELEAHKRRIAELEATIASLDPPTLRSKEMQAQRILALENEKSALEQRERALSARVDGLTAANAALTARTEQLTAQHETLMAERDALAVELATERAAAREREAQAASAAPSDEQAAEARAQAEQIEALEQEIARLEGALRERGRDLAKLARDLRETERVGRELLFDLEVARRTPGPGPGGGGGAGPSETSERLARAEADLLSANWNIARLERELDDARPSTGTARDANRDMALALAAAQREIAVLRAGALDAPAQAVTTTARATKVGVDGDAS